MLLSAPISDTASRTCLVCYSQELPGGKPAYSKAMSGRAPVYTNRLQCCECGRVSREKETVSAVEEIVVNGLPMTKMLLAVAGL